MKSEAEVKEKLTYYRGYAEGLRKSGGSKSEETEATRVWAWIDALVWVLEEEERTNEHERTDK